VIGRVAPNNTEKWKERLPVGLACHGRSSEHVGGNEMSLLSGSSQWQLTG